MEVDSLIEGLELGWGPVKWKQGVGLPVKVGLVAEMTPVGSRIGTAVGGRCQRSVPGRKVVEGVEGVKKDLGPVASQAQLLSVLGDGI